MHKFEFLFLNFCIYVFQKLSFPKKRLSKISVKSSIIVSSNHFEKTLFSDYSERSFSNRRWETNKISKSSNYDLRWQNGINLQFCLLSPDLDSKILFSEAGLKLFLNNCQNCFGNDYDLA